MVPELHDMRIVCLLKAVTPAWVTYTIPFLLVIDYIHHDGSFEILQAKSNVIYQAGPRVGCRVPQTNITPRVVDQFVFLSN